MTDTETTLTERIDQARERSSELAANATTRAREFVHDHPVASIAGGIVVGALIAAALSRSRPQTPAERAGSAIDAGTARLGKLAALAAELALAYAAKTASAGKDGADKIEERLTEQLHQLGGNSAEVGRKLSGLADMALTALREASEAALHKVKRRD